MPETNNLKDPEANQLDQFTSMAEDLNSELPWTNPAGGQSGTWTGASELHVQRSNHSAMLRPAVLSSRTCFERWASVLRRGS